MGCVENCLSGEVGLIQGIKTNTSHVECDTRLFSPDNRYFRMSTPDCSGTAGDDELTTEIKASPVDFPPPLHLSLEQCDAQHGNTGCAPWGPQ